MYVTKLFKPQTRVELLSTATKFLTSDKNKNDSNSKKPKRSKTRNTTSKALIIYPSNKNNKEINSSTSKRSTHQLHNNGITPLSRPECALRLQFAKEMLQRLDQNPKLIDNIVFSDECNFWHYFPKSKNSKELICGPPNRNFKKSLKKQVYAESKPLPTIAWCGITTKEVIGPYFFNAQITGSSYLLMLRKFLFPELKLLNYNVDSTWFQQDGTLAHRSPNVISFLKERFGSRLIARGNEDSLLAWPHRSRDLSPLNYFLWEFMRTKMVMYKPRNSENLRECLSFEMESLDPEVLDRFVRVEFIARLEKCIEAGGGRFYTGHRTISNNERS